MITFVATAYKETKEAYMFLSSLLLQTNPNWKCIVYSDEPNDYVKNVINHFNDDRITYYENEVAKKFWGHHNRKFALETLVDTDFVIQASIQDYYIPITVSLILDVANDFDFILYNCIHNQFGYNILDSSMKAGRIDWSSFATRTSIAKQIGIPKPEATMADGLFVEDLKRIKNLRKCKINRVLVVHN